MLMHNSRKKGSQSLGESVSSWGRGLHGNRVKNVGFGVIVSFSFLLLAFTTLNKSSCG
jgi:hypothetical protein